MRARSRAWAALRARSRIYLRRTRSMNAERECLEPAKRSTLAKTSVESVIEVFSFILLTSYHKTEGTRKAKRPGFGSKTGRFFLSSCLVKRSDLIDRGRSATYH